MLLSSLYSFQYNAKFYMGIGGGTQNESLSHETKKISNTHAFGSIKFGYGDIRAYAIEIALNYIDNRSKIFSSKDSQRIGGDMTLLKAFNFTNLFYPYLKAGFGAGEMKVKRSLENKVAYSSYNIGGGIFLPLLEHIDFEAAYEYRYASYQSVDLIATKLHLKSHINQIYFGINYRF